MLIRTTDSLIDKWSQDACATAADCLGTLENQLAMMNAVATNNNTNAPGKIIAMIKSVFQLMGENEADRLIDFCRNDKTFISTWGTPAHYAIFQRFAAH